MGKTLEHERRLYLNALMMIKEIVEIQEEKKVFNFKSLSDDRKELYAVIKRELEICELVKSNKDCE